MTYRRDEDEDDRLDRQWGELLQELRLAQTGTQILFAFLLTIPFTQPFRDSDQFTHLVYGGTLLTAAIALGLFLAPVPFHRIVYRHLLRDRLLSFANRLTTIGLLFLLAALSGGMLLGFDVIATRGLAIAVVSVVAAGLLLLWYALPAWVRYSSRRPGEGSRDAGSTADGD